MNAALHEVGLSSVLGSFLANPIYNLHQNVKVQAMQKQRGLLQRIWFYIRNPWAILSGFGLRRFDQKNEHGKPVIDLDQLAAPGVIEHDVSLTRRDHLQKEGNCKSQQDLVASLLKCSKDGKNITMEDLANHRKFRIQQQLDDNPGLHYGAAQHQVACSEIALILAVFGNGKSVPCDYAKAFFEEERLPVKEGWKKRWWWTVGFLEMKKTTAKVKALVGLDI